MKFIVTKITQIENAVLVEADDAAQALDHYHDGYGNFTETKDSTISKTTVQEVNETPATPAQGETPPVVV